MPTLSIFAIISLLMALVSVRVLVTTLKTRGSLFDAHLTRSDRQQLSEIALFLLLPVSVLLHEAGHAVAVRLFGGQILGFGYYFFFGYVEHTGFYTPSEVFWIALSGNLVSVMIGLVAIGLPLVRSMRPSFNYLLFVFGAIDLANSLVFYPLLDLAGNFLGDWSQIYSGDTPSLSAATGIVHATIVIAAVIAWRSDRFRRIYAQRTGQNLATVRRITRREAANELLEVGEQLSTAWQHPLRVVADAQNGAAGVTLHWISGGYGRVVGAYAVLEGWRRVELHGGIHTLDESANGHRQPLGFIEGIPSREEMTQALTRALDMVEGWEPAPREDH